MQYLLSQPFPGFCTFNNNFFLPFMSFTSLILFSSALFSVLLFCFVIFILNMSELAEAHIADMMYKCVRHVCLCMYTVVHAYILNWIFFSFIFAPVCTRLTQEDKWCT